jgi:protein TonB
MPRIHQSSNLAIALVLSVAINAALIVGLSQLLEKPAIQRQPPVQRLSLATAPEQADAEHVGQTEEATINTQASTPIAEQSESEAGAATEPASQTTSSESQAPVIVSDTQARNNVAPLQKQDAPLPAAPEPVEKSKAPPSANTDEPTAAEVEPDLGNTESESADTTQPVSNTEARAANNTEVDTAPPNEVAIRSDLVAAINPQTTTQPSNTGPQSSPPEDTSALPLAQVDYRPELDYPAMAKRRRQQGQVTLRAWLNDKGELEQLSVAESSGHSLLDESALEQIGSWSFKPPDNNNDQRWIRIPVEFRLR